MFIRGEFFHMVSVREKESDWTNKPEINRQCSPRPASNRRGGTHLRKPWENIYTISFSRKGLPALNKQTGNKQAMLSQPSNSSLRYKFTFDFYPNSLKKHNRHTLYLSPLNKKSLKIQNVHLLLLLYVNSIKCGLIGQLQWFHEGMSGPLCFFYENISWQIQYQDSTCTDNCSPE